MRCLRLRIVLVLMIVIISGLLCGTAYAAEKCGENVTWSFSSSSGVLTIRGTGEMTNYTQKTSPWDNNMKKNIKSVVINEGVTHIGAYVFSQCDNLISVTIADSVISIGDYAFYGCSKLETVNIPAQVKTIGSYAFGACAGLSTVTYSGTQAEWNEISIGSYNTGLMGASVTFLMPEGSCGTDVRWSLSNDGELIISGTGAMDTYTADNAAPWQSYAGSITLVTIGDQVTHIGNRAFFACTGLKAILIPDSVTSIGDYAFDGCTNLTDVLILGDSTLIAEDAFANVSGVTLYGHVNSNTQIYAVGKGIPFIEIQGIHALIETPQVDATCLAAGQDAYWTCRVCGKMFSDAAGTNEITEPIAIRAEGHTLEKHARVEPTATKGGTEEYWECTVCHQLFSDANGQKVITEPETIPCATTLDSSCSEATWYLGLQGYSPERSGLYSYTSLGFFRIPESVWDENDRTVYWSLTCTDGPDNFQLDYDPDSIDQREVFTASLKPKEGTMVAGDSAYTLRAGYKGVYYMETITIHTVDTGLPIGTTIRIFETDENGTTIGNEVSISSGSAVLESGKNYFLTGSFDGVNIDIWDQWMNCGAVSNGLALGGGRWQGDVYSTSDGYRICRTNSTMLTTGDTGTYSCHLILSLRSASNLASRIPLSFKVMNESTEPRTIILNKTNGTVDGEAEDVSFSYWDGSDPTGTVHSFTRQNLDNHYTRFIVEYTAPEGLLVCAFAEADKVKYNNYEDVTSSGRERVLFDVPSSILEEISCVNINFYGDNGSSVVGVTADLPHQTDPQPTESSVITFSLTDGTPVEEGVERLAYYFSRFDGAQDMTGTLHNAVRQRLDNGKSRITIQYTVPAGLRVIVAARPNATKLYDSDEYSIVTAFGRSILQFDISDSTYNTFSAIQVLFQKPDCNAFGLLVYPHADTADPDQATIIMNQTEGKTVGDETDVRIVQQAGWIGKLYSGKMQKLDNEYTRFTLHFSVPDGSFARVASRTFDFYCATVGTSSIHNTLQVDLPDDGLEGWDSFTVQFTYLDQANSFSVYADVYYSNQDELFDLDKMSVLYLPNGLTAIGEEAFEGLACEAIIVPRGCESIGSHAFRGCEELRYIRVPVGTEIAGDAFEGCSDVYIERVAVE